MENLEKFIIFYGQFKDISCTALSCKDEIAGKEALTALEEIFKLIPEETVKEKFPKLYTSLEKNRSDLTNWKNYV